MQPFILRLTDREHADLKKTAEDEGVSMQRLAMGFLIAGLERARIAQQIERSATDREVGGANPPAGTKAP